MDNLTRVYRIETGTGCGAFSAGLSRVHDSAVPGDLYRSCYDGPSPMGEALNGNTTLLDAYRAQSLSADFRFGCTSLEQLREWFFSPEGCRLMGNEGGLLVTYDVPADAVHTGIKQSIFDKSRAVPVSSVPAGLLHLEF